MKILAIETSCDETAIAILECEGDEKNARFTVLGNALFSQIEIHKEYGGVFPALAKREHAKNLVPILEAALEEAELLHEDTQTIPEEKHEKIATILSREPGLIEAFFAFIGECEPPPIDAIAVTTGPGLEPALWVGVNFAKALAVLWEKPLIAVNHMEGHLLAALASRKQISSQTDQSMFAIFDVRMPVLALLVSGGHTELVHMREWLTYELIGQTRDDAVGEAFDKVARMLGLPYPGGPEISRLAEIARETQRKNPYVLPRPMLHDATCDFSFAGLKTSVLYLLRDTLNIREEDKRYIAREFEDAVVDVLWGKTVRALNMTDPQTLVIGGGVSANTHIRRVFTEKIKNEYPHITLCLSIDLLATDNAIMIAFAGFYRALRNNFSTPDSLTVNGNRSLA